jgi:Ser-tRNA(Ala) deacylase AlaX
MRNRYGTVQRVNGYFFWKGKVANMEIKTLTTLEELESLGSALTMEGLAEDSISEFIDWVKQYTPMKSETAYIIKGKTMNDVYMLTGNNKYPDGCTIVSIKLEDMENSMAVVIPRFNIGARWFDDIVMNNAAREK